MAEPVAQCGNSIVGICIVNDTTWRFGRGDFTLIALLKWRRLALPAKWANTQPSA
jgi:hypothetical protein